MQAGNEGSRTVVRGHEIMGVYDVEPTAESACTEFAQCSPVRSARLAPPDHGNVRGSEFRGKLPDIFDAEYGHNLTGYPLPDREVRHDAFKPTEFERVNNMQDAERGGD